MPAEFDADETKRPDAEWSRREAARANRENAGVAGRDIEEVAARRVERADLVRSILQRKQDVRDDVEPNGTIPVSDARIDADELRRALAEHADDAAGPASAEASAGMEAGARAEAPRHDRPDSAAERPGGAPDTGVEADPRADRARHAEPAGEGGADPAAEPGGTPAALSAPGAASAPSSGADNATADTIAMPRPLLSDASDASDATADTVAMSRPLFADAADAAGVRSESGSEPGAGAGLATTGPAAAADRDRPAEPSAVGTPPKAPATQALSIIPVSSSAPASQATPAALAALREWRAETAAEHERVALAQMAAKTPLGRDRADPANDFERALRAEGGADFLRRIVDEVVRPEDAIVAGNGLGDAREHIPSTLSIGTRAAFRVGGVAGPGLPWVTVPALRRATRAFFGDETVDDAEESRRSAIHEASERGSGARVRLLGDPVLGERAASARFQRLLELVADPTVNELEVCVADLDGQPSLWDVESTSTRLIAKLASLYRAASAGPRPTRIIVRATSSADLELAVTIAMRALELPELLHVEGGIAIPAQFPETPGILRRIAGWAHMRREDLGAPVVVSLTREASIERERAEAVVRGWRLATYAREEDVDANMIRLVDAALSTEHFGALRVEIEGAVARDVAFAATLSRMRGNPHPLRVIVPRSASAVARDRIRRLGAEPVVRLPLIPAGVERAAVPYLLRRIDEDAASHASLEFEVVPGSARDELHPDDDRLLRSVARMHQIEAGPARRQERVHADDAATVTASIPLDLVPPELLEEEGVHAGDAEGAGAAGDASDGATGTASSAAGVGTSAGPGVRRPALAGASRPEPDDHSAGAPVDTGPAPALTQVVLGLKRGRSRRTAFANSPVSDPTVASTREWVRHIQRRIPRSDLGVAEAQRVRVETPERVEEILGAAVAAGAEWGSTHAGWERAAHLERIAKAVDANRARIVECVVSETGLPAPDADADVSRAIDAANYAAVCARELDRVQGARFEPVAVTVVVPSWTPPAEGIAAPAFAALAAGSAAIVKPSPRTVRTAALIAGVVWDAGIPADLFQVAVCDDRRFSDEELGRALITDERVERVLHSGTWETARMFLQWRPDLPLLAATSAKNAVIVTPSADLDEAARDIARSAFLGAGQRAGHVGTVILVGSVARSQRFHEQLADAVASLRIGYPTDPAATVGPLIEPADSQLRFALSQLGEGESWLVEPRQLDDTGRLWTPGIRAGVKPGSYAHLNEFFGPVLGVMHALTLNEAIGLQNATQYGLVAGLYSHDRHEIAQWVQEAQAGSLFVNRDTVGSLAGRQPVGGWKRSAVGRTQKLGGPNMLVPLGRWVTDPGEQSSTLHLRGLDEKVSELIEAAQPHLGYDAFDFVRRCALSDQIAWNEEFGQVTDVANLGVERNLLRYLPTATTIRLAEGGSLAWLVRELVAARVVRAIPDVSTSIEIPASIRAVLDEWQVPVRDETDARFAARMREGDYDSTRIRLVGGSRKALCDALGGDADIAIWAQEPTQSGRIELLPFVREQAISITAQRFGRPDARVQGLFPHETTVERGLPGA